MLPSQDTFELRPPLRHLRPHGEDAEAAQQAVRGACLSRMLRAHSIFSVSRAAGYHVGAFLNRYVRLDGRVHQSMRQAGLASRWDAF